MLSFGMASRIVSIKAVSRKHFRPPSRSPQLVHRGSKDLNVPVAGRGRLRLAIPRLVPKVLLFDRRQNNVQFARTQRSGASFKTEGHQREGGSRGAGQSGCLFFEEFLHQLGVLATGSAVLSSLSWPEG